MTTVRLRNVARVYPMASALKKIDLEIPEGQWLSIMGPSGSGKTTLLNIIGGLDFPTSGEVLIGDTCTSQIPAGSAPGTARPGAMTEDELAQFRQTTIGVIFQQAYLIPFLNAVENVMLAQYFHSLTDEAEAIRVLERVELGHRLRHRPGQLSGGEQQRVCIARSLINNPRILLADEPTGNLDTGTAHLILDLLKKFHQHDKFTVVLVTHDPAAAAWGDRIIHMKDGLICDG